MLISFKLRSDSGLLVMRRLLQSIDMSVMHLRVEALLEGGWPKAIDFGGVDDIFLALHENVQLSAVVPVFPVNFVEDVVVASSEIIDPYTH